MPTGQKKKNAQRSQFISHGWCGNEFKLQSLRFIKNGKLVETVCHQDWNTSNYLVKEQPLCNFVYNLFSCQTNQFWDISCKNCVRLISGYAPQTTLNYERRLQRFGEDYTNDGKWLCLNLITNIFVLFHCLRPNNGLEWRLERVFQWAWFIAEKRCFSSGGNSFNSWPYWESVSRIWKLYKFSLNL